MHDDRPRRLRFAIRHFGLDKLRVLDLGCGPGTYLRRFGPGSVGVDLYPEAGRAAGLDVREWNFTEGLPDDLRWFDAVWCSAILEHVLAPHEFLISVRDAGERLFVLVPNTTPMRRPPWKGHLAADHVNFFTPRTLRLTIERAGYEVDFLGSPSLPVPLAVAQRLAPVGPLLMAVARPTRGWQYPDKALKRLVDGQVVWKGPQFED